MASLAILLAASPQIARADYRAKALEATDFIQRSFYDPSAKLYRPALPADPKALPFDFMWGNGVQFSVLTAASHEQPTRFRPLLYDFASGLEKYWDADAKTPGFDAYFSSPNGDDKYFDDNAWLALGFCEAYHDTRDPQFLKKARLTQNFVLSGWDDKLGGGIYWYQQKLSSKNTCVSAPAAAASLELFDLTKNPEDLAWAKRLTSWTQTKLQAPNALYFDNINLDGKIEKTQWTYNSALMIRAQLGLFSATQDAKYLREARRISDAALEKWTAPQSGVLADSARFNHLLCEALLRTYEATRDPKYLNAVRRNADFAYRYGRDARNGGYFDSWSAATHAPDERKTLIENASVARMFWVLAPYPDAEELQVQGRAALKRGDQKAALSAFSQALASTAGATPTRIETPEKRAVS